MRLPPRVLSVLAFVGLALAVAGGATAGISVANRVNAPAHRDVAIANPAAVTSNASVLRSAGGFTGFDPPAGLGGQVVRTGKIGGAQGGTFEVTGNGSALAVRSTASTRLFRIVRARTPLAVGDLVQVRAPENAPATGVLRLPADLHDGENRAPAPARPSASQ